MARMRLSSSSLLYARMRWVSTRTMKATMALPSRREVKDVVVVEVEWGRWSEEEEMSEMSVRDAQRGLCAVNRGASARADHVLLCC